MLARTHRRVSAVPALPVRRPEGVRIRRLADESTDSSAEVDANLLDPQQVYDLELAQYVLDLVVGEPSEEAVDRPAGYRSSSSWGRWRWRRWRWRRWRWRRWRWQLAETR